MSKTKQFPLDAVLSVTTGRLLCDMGGVYEILNHVTGDNLFTHVLPRACKFAAPLILAQYPELGKVGTPEMMVNLDMAVAEAKQNQQSPMVGCKTWLNRIGLRNEYAIESHADCWLTRDPIEEAEAMVGKDKVVIVSGERKEKP